MSLLSLITTLWWGALPAGSPWQPGMRVSLPRHDLLGKERWPISQRKRAKSLFLQWAFIGFNLHRNTGKAHHSFSSSKDQTIDNKQRTLRAYSESGSVS